MLTVQIAAGKPLPPKFNISVPLKSVKGDLDFFMEFYFSRCPTKLGPLAAVLELAVSKGQPATSSVESWPETNNQ
jgi:hypothetical protein